MLGRIIRSRLWGGSCVVRVGGRGVGRGRADYGRLIRKQITSPAHLEDVGNI
jgi:hypothetical protein